MVPARSPPPRALTATARPPARASRARRPAGAGPLETALRGGSGLAAHRSAEPAGFLAVHASARRLVILFREADRTGALTGIAAAETLGDVDNLEELLLRLDDPDGIVEAAQWLVATSRRLRHPLPDAVRDGVEELELLLGPLA